jgi:predicted unusual protein kinase regulating ubiquinone biosynthesis (AarF/ABC1/UbiB family)
MRDNVRVSDVPKNPVARAAKMARLPIGLAGRTALGVGKRIGGRPAEIVAQEIQQRTADQIFRVLGELKGGAMKMGQALSIFEAALPPEIAGPYRATLTRLQESAPPLPARSVHQVLARDLGEDWRDNFAEFNDTPAAAASIGQVHQAVWKDGRTVAVKIQYPGAGRALISDFNQLSRAGRLFGLLMPGLEVKPLLDELRDRVTEELNYELEAASQQAFADAYAGDPDIYVPGVVTGTDHVLVSEWMNGTPLSSVISDGSKEERDRAGILLVRFLFSGPARAGLLHADPHPGNFRLLDDGRLGVLDFGAVDRLPDGLPPFFGRLLRIMHDDNADIEAVERELRANGFLRPGIDVDLDALRDFLAPMAEPSKVDSFKFSREWLRGEASRVTSASASNITRRFNLPPSYVLIHRVSTAGIGVLCQLECEGEFRAEVLKWIPGYFDPAPIGGTDPAEAGSGPEPEPGGASGDRTAVNAFGAAMVAGDMTEVSALLHPDVTFSSPAVFQPYRGRAATLLVLAAAAETFEDFAYVAQAHGPQLDVLRFRARVGRYEIEGVDILTTDEVGRITDITVMVRPLRGLEALVAAMQQTLARSQESTSLPSGLGWRRKSTRARWARIPVCFSTWTGRWWPATPPPPRPETGCAAGTCGRSSSS